MQLGQLGGGVGAQLLGEDTAGVLERGERLGPAARPVEGADELAARALPQRVGGHQVAQLGQQGAVLAPAQLGLVEILAGGQPQLLQAFGLGAGEGGRPGIREGGTPPQRQGVAQQAGGTGVVGRAERRAAVGGQPLEAVGVDVVGVDREPVARGMELDGRSGAIGSGQAAAQPRHQGLEGVGGPLRWGVAVQPVDQPLGTDHLPGVEQQEDQQPAEP
ncbi:hypothetical protein NOGI109294_25715 [Nocardiopsis gilva]